jgi:hypothetical protein
MPGVLQSEVPCSAARRSAGFSTQPKLMRISVRVHPDEHEVDDKLKSTMSEA